MGLEVVGWFLMALFSGDPLLIAAVGGLILIVGVRYAFQKRNS